MDIIKAISIVKIDNGQKQEITDDVIVERLLTIFVNKEFYVSLMCTPMEIMELAIGFLFAEGIIDDMNMVSSIEEKAEDKVCVILKHGININLNRSRALTSGCAQGTVDLDLLKKHKLKAVESSCKFPADAVLKLMKDFNHKSQLFRETGGVHSCAICSEKEIKYFSEDIGRHNALDKVIGKALLCKADLSEKLVMTTGRLSSDIVLKAAKAGIPMIVSHSAPTDMAVGIAKEANITMLGFARGNRMNVYCGEHRIS